MENKIKKIKDITIFILLTIWILVPILKEILIVRHEIICVNFIGLIGIYLFLLKLYEDFMSKQNKKEFLKENLPIFILFIFMLWTLISSIFASDRDLAFNGDVYRKEGYLTYLTYAGFFGLAYFLESKKLKNILLNIFVIVAIFNMIFMLLVSNGYIEGSFWAEDIRKGVFENINHYGYYLLLVTIITGLLFVYQKNKYVKVLYLCAYAFLMYFLILNNTFGVYLALCCALVLFFIYCIYKKKRVFLSTVPIIILIIMSLITKNGQEIIILNNIKGFKDDIQKIAQVFLYNGNNETTDEYITNKEFESAGSGRMQIWKYGIKFALEKPIFGYGPDNLGRKYLEENIFQDRPHNLLIQLANTSGIPGLILYVTAIGIILIRAIKTMNENNSLHIVLLFTLVAYLISAMFGNSMYYTSPYFFILLGFLMGENVKEMVYKN